MREASLQQIQSWMSSVLISRGDLRQKLGRAATRHGLAIEDVVVHRRGPSRERRLDVYAAGYVLRLVQCLSDDFPALRRFLGQQLFETFARAYIVEHPPHSPSLFDLGREFPEFLARTQPAGGAAPGELDWFAVPAALARLERACSEATRAPGLEARGFAAAASPCELLTGQVQVSPAPCLTLLTLQPDVLDIHASVERGEPLPPPRPEQRCIAISRAHYRVTTRRLEPWQEAFLRWCQAAREPVSPLAWLESAESDAQGHLPELLVWLPIAAGLGLVAVAARSDRRHVGGRA